MTTINKTLYRVYYKVPVNDFDIEFKIMYKSKNVWSNEDD